MYKIIHTDLSVTDDVDVPGLAPRLLRFDLGATEMEAVRRVFGAPAADGYWRILTPEGRIDVRCRPKQHTVLVTDNPYTLTWYFKVVFGTPAGFVRRAIRHLGVFDTVIAYKEYLSLRHAALLAHPSDDRRETAAARAWQVEELEQMCQLGMSGLVGKLRLRVRAYTASTASLARGGHQASELFADHLATLAAIALSAEDTGEAPVDPARPETQVLSLNLQHLPFLERNWLDVNGPAPRLFTMRFEDGFYVCAGDLIPRADVVRAFPLLCAFLQRAQVRGQGWIFFGPRVPAIDGLPQF